jgi:tRNA nucleotidyltransferase (CCA-adding enzyme)
MTQRLTILNVPEQVRAASQRLKDQGAEVYIVGGAVRDLLLGRDPGDFDLATNVRPEVVAACFPFSVPTGIDHGTVTVWLNARGQGPGLEVTTYRGESAYSDGRRPDSVTFMSRIEDDLARRDFTINAMALDPFTLTLVDPFGGRDDANAKLIRAVGDAKTRFNEDGLRSMRAVRFSACLEFRLDPATEAAIGETLAIVRRVASATSS